MHYHSKVFENTKFLETPSKNVGNISLLKKRNRFCCWPLFNLYICKIVLWIILPKYLCCRYFTSHFLNHFLLIFSFNIAGKGFLMFSRGIEKERRRGTVNEVQLLALNFEHIQHNIQVHWLVFILTLNMYLSAS